MSTINCDKVSLRLACNHTLVMSDVAKVEYDDYSITITLEYDNVLLLKREVTLYPESFTNGLAVRVVRCYKGNCHLGTFERDGSNIKFVPS